MVKHIQLRFKYVLGIFIRRTQFLVFVYKILMRVTDENLIYQYSVTEPNKH